jgi:hypothetical protein
MWFASHIREIDMFFVYVFHPSTGRYDFICDCAILGLAEHVARCGRPPGRRNSPRRVVFTLETAQTLSLIGG